MTLVVLAGLPGAGKSTLAARIGAALPAPVLAVDAVERVRRRVERRLAADPGAATWAYTLARSAEYEPWPYPVLVIDTARPGDPLDAVLSYLRPAA